MAEAESYPRTLAALESRFAEEDSCLEYLFALRWPEGFLCPHCSGFQAWKMARGLWVCVGCRRQISVLAGTVFQDTHLPMKTWFRAMWNITSQKNGMRALGLQRVLGLGSYRSACLMLHKLRQAMVRPGREKLHGKVEVDETYWGAVESDGATGRKTLNKALIMVAAEVDGRGGGRIRMALIPDFNRETLHRFIGESIDIGSTVCTDALNSYRELKGYRHDRKVQNLKHGGQAPLPRVHLVISLLKRW